MFLRSFARQLPLLAAATAVGWYAHTPAVPVLAQRSHDAGRDSSHTGDVDTTLGVQFGTAALGNAVAVWSARDRSIYVYPLGGGGEVVNCSYRLQVQRPGEPLQRANCGPGVLNPR